MVFKKIRQNSFCSENERMRWTYLIKWFREIYKQLHISGTGSKEGQTKQLPKTSLLKDVKLLGYKICITFKLYSKPRVITI